MGIGEPEECIVRMESAVKQNATIMWRLGH
jgi:hypothetical protein